VQALLLELADAVQRAVGQIAGDPGEVLGRGADGAPSLRIDRVAERAVLDLLAKEQVRLNVLSEEAGSIDRGGEATLVLDPIDGTHNAVRGIPFYGVSIAIGRDQLVGVEEGLVRDLVSGATYYAAKGRGATLNGRTIRVRPFDPEDSVASVYLGTNAHPDSNRVASRARRTRSLGSAALELCLVARGAMDMYYLNSAVRAAELRIVDMAAGTLIVREAGGRVVDLQGRDLDLPLDLEARTNLVAYGDPRAWEALR